MGKKKRFGTGGISILTSRFTATVSVTLVLLLLAFVAVTAIVARGVVDSVRSEMGYVIVMAEDASPADINNMKQRLGTLPSTAGYDYASPEIVRERWLEMIGDDEDERVALESLEVNPFLPEFEVNVKPQFATAGALKPIAEELGKAQGVESVTLHLEMVDDINRTTNEIILVMLCVAVALLIISFVLINNTVRLTVYARRFTIHTMRLVGATNSFIRRPFLVTNVVVGLVSGLIADALLAVLTAYARAASPEASVLFSWGDFALVAVATLAAGVVICLLAALFATNKYLSREYDDLFK